MKRMAVPDITQFPDRPRWATFIPNRDPQFKLHTSLGQAKNALRSKGITVRRGGEDIVKAGYPSWVYEWVDDPELGDGWVERFHVLADDILDDHPLWAFKEARRKRREIPQAVIDKTIASLMVTAQEVSIRATDG